ncbi:radical SAM protein [Pyramidobacter sp. YE332]|uniref:radical SAM protein n=1 Tax=Pyramidobacter sp. YE332 TaxID=3068894 RepID=UPI00294B727E|nr:radical SAM protein [Pyramidobacter sp. YE332]WOL40471.1 radical SAM protein [Pyramidobacter sp. YE332]
MKIRLSIGTAAALGLARLKSDALPTTAYLMDTGGRCAHNCAFCAQAREAETGEDHLSRVIWPVYDLGDVLSGLITAARGGTIRRACIQVTLNAGSFERTLVILKAVTNAVSLPVSVSTNITSASQVDRLMGSGAARVSIALDAATQSLHDQVKGTGYARKVQLLTECARRYPGRITTHFIVGLGESEEDVIAAIQNMHDLNVTVGLFAFTPLRGTRMAKCPPPEAGRYRRVQLANWLIKTKRRRVSDMSFSNGRLSGIDGDIKELLSVLSSGEAFETAGCRDCNRPYYNENPGHGVMYNYPRPLKNSEVIQALKETHLFAQTDLNDLTPVTGKETRRCPHEMAIH